MIFHFLDVDDFLLLTGLFFFFGLVVFELAEVHDSANRGNGLSRHFNEVQLRLLGHTERLLDPDDSGLIAVLVNEPDLSGTDVLIRASCVS